MKDQISHILSHFTWQHKPLFVVSFLQILLEVPQAVVSSVLYSREIYCYQKSIAVKLRAWVRGLSSFSSSLNR